MNRITLSPKQLAAFRALSAFEQKVLRACRRIPIGETKSYSDIAREIGKPDAARAVGNALAKNPFAPLVPCHRVVRKDGTPGGYSGRGGTKAKEMLLSKERRMRRKSG